MEMKKSLSVVDLFCLTSGAMISSGIFILPGMAFSHVGPAVILSYLLAGIFGLVGILSVIEIITAMPKAGGDYYFITRTLGPLAGTVSGLLSWLAVVLKTSFAIFGMGEVICQLAGWESFMGIDSVFMCSVLITIIFTVLNFFGVKEAAFFQIVLVVFLFIIMAGFVAVGLPSVGLSKFEPFVFKTGASEGILWTAGFVFISFGGLLKITSVSEEVKNPKRSIPAGLILSIIVVTIIYAFMLFVTIGVMDPEKLKGSMMPIADAASVFFGTPGFWAISIAAMLAFITTANAGIMAASRYPMALSRDELAPAVLGGVSKKYDTPIVAIIITGILIIISLSMKLEMLVKAASTVILLSYIISNLCVIILRESKIVTYHPSFTAPFYPFTQIVSVVVFMYLIISMGRETIFISLVLIGLSVVFYYIYGRKVNTEYALLHLLERITNRKLTSNNLEKELIEVIHQRDNIVKDEFDHIIEKASFYDIEKSISRDDLFKHISEKFSKDIDLKPEELYRLLTEREEDSSTAISPFVAIPHIIAEGSGIFKILVVRCRNGACFSETNNDVKAIFFIIGSRDTRNFHLKTLGSIAQITYDSHFERRWEEAKNEDDLRSLLLLGKRKRHN